MSTDELEWHVQIEKSIKLSHIERDNTIHIM